MQCELQAQAPEQEPIHRPPRQIPEAQVPGVPEKRRTLIEPTSSHEHSVDWR